MIRSEKPEVTRIDNYGGKKFTQGQIDFFKYVDGAPNTQKLIVIDPEADLQNSIKKMLIKK